tara:strand:- start:1193 stop:1480 length:288 start_codon:yes stop_codon:yes gene_type:complete
MQIGKAIVQLRKERGINQDDFSKMIGISSTALSQIERNISTPKKNTLNNILFALNTNESIIHIMCINIDDVPFKKRFLINGILDNQIKILLNIYK